MKNLLSFVVVAVVAFSCNRDLRGPQDDLISIGKKNVIHSSVLGEDRPFWVSVPPHDPATNKKFPVLYLLDGDAHFHSVTGLISHQAAAGTIPEMIVVGIPNTDRTRDLTPSNSLLIDGESRDFLKTSGGNDKFWEFVRTELIPKVEATYPTHPYRVLVGHSFGGIAAINALYTIPDTFDAYISIDPSIWWDHQRLLKKADSVFSTAHFDNKYFFLGQANTLKPGESTNDHFGSIKEYVKVLESPSNKSGLKWSYKYYPDDSHGSVPLVNEYDGLRFIFHDYNPSAEMLVMDPEALKRKFEQYRMPPPEGVVNRLGYFAMGEKNFDRAEQYFQMNIDAYPESSNAYDSMGELMLNKGDTVKAVQLYKRSLELDPRNTNASKVIEDVLAKKK